MRIFRTANRLDIDGKTDLGRSTTEKPRTPRIRTLGTTTLVAAVCAATSVAPVASAQEPPKGAVVKTPVTFEVRNLNRSLLACRSDGAAYDVKGHLVAPRAMVEESPASDDQAATLYLHGFTLGAQFWSFDAVPRYDYAVAMARAGHASVVIDRLGYGASGRPAGDETCLGAAADVAHQVIGKLRSGDYLAEGGEPTRFDKVALAGHSMGALIASLAAYSFGDIDALVGVSHTPQVTQQAFESFYANRTICEAGGELSHSDGPGGYAYFGQSVAEVDANVFHSAEPAVRTAVTPLRARDPCGETASIIDALVRDLKSRSRITVPVLLVCGREDAVTPEFACPHLKRRYTGSRDVSLVFVPNAGHALPLERTAPIFRRRMSAWLDAHGF